MTTPSVLLRNASLSGSEHVDLLLQDGRVTSIGRSLSSAGARVFDAAGGAVLPGLHDHHCHLLAMAAARDSVVCGPPEVNDREELATALHGGPAFGGWLRGVGYHESVAGDLDRHVLDGLRDDLPVRVQHRGGSAWFLNSAAIAALGLDSVVDGEPMGVERNADGRATGCLWRCDDWLRDRLGPRPAPDLAAVSAQLASYGVTGITDATPDLDAAALELMRAPGLRQRLILLGGDDSVAPSKIVVSDHALPGFDDLAALIGATRPRAVAVHCVTRASLALTVAALREVGTVNGDRIEHAAVVPPELADVVSDLGLTVVTQPSLPALRGDRYLDDVEPEDREHLWPFASLLAAGVPVGCSSDAPFGSPDPWFAIASAVSRQTSSGRRIGNDERVSAATALHGYLTHPLDPGGPARRVDTGTPADLVLLDAPLDEVLADPDAAHVRFTLVGGEVIHSA